MPLPVPALSVALAAIFHNGTLSARLTLHFGTFSASICLDVGFPLFDWPLNPGSFLVYSRFAHILPGCLFCPLLRPGSLLSTGYGTLPCRHAGVMTYGYYAT